MSQDLSTVDVVLLSDGWHIIDPGSFTIALDDMNQEAWFTFTVGPNGSSGILGAGTVTGPWSSVKAWRSPS